MENSKDPKELKRLEEVETQRVLTLYKEELKKRNKPILSDSDILRSEEFAMYSERYDIADVDKELYDIRVEINNIIGGEKFLYDFDESTVGKIREDGFIEKEYYGQGSIYKNYKNFERKEGICYIPEYGMDRIEVDSEDGNDYYTYNSIMEEIKYDLTEQYGVNIETLSEEQLHMLCEDVFDMVDWQHVSSLLNGDMYLEDFVGQLEENSEEESI